MKKFFLHDGKNHIGPFTADELKQKGITSQTNVWHEGSPGWIPAGEVEELKVFFIPPPVVPAFSQANVIKEKRKFPLWGIIVSAVIVIGIVVLVIVLSNSNNNDGSESSNSSSSNIENSSDQSSDDSKIEKRKANIRENYEDFYMITGDYKYSGIGGIYDGSIILENKSDYPIDALTVAVEIYTSASKLYTTKYVDFINVPANGTDIKYFDCKERGQSCVFSICYVKADYVGLKVSNCDN